METRIVPSGFRLMSSEYPELPKNYVPRFSTIRLHACTPLDGQWVRPVTSISGVEILLQRMGKSKKMRLAPVSVRDYFVKNPRRIPKRWKGKTIFFGADTFQWFDRSNGECHCYHMVPGMKQSGTEWLHVYREKLASFTPDDYLAVCIL